MSEPKTKRYYWIKITDNFYTSPLKKQMRRKLGDTACIVYTRILTLVAPTDGIFHYSGVCDTTAEEIAETLDEKYEIVNSLLDFLEKKKQISREANNPISDIGFHELPEVVGSESESAERTRQYRERMKLLEKNNGNTTMSRSDGSTSQSDTKRNKEELHSDIELQKETELHLDNRDTLIGKGKSEGENPENIHSNLSQLKKDIREKVGAVKYAEYVQEAPDDESYQLSYYQSILVEISMNEEK